MFPLRALFCAAFALMFSAAAADAHITFTQRSAPADSYFRTAFTVPHGCDGAATTKISIWLPEKILSARPQAKPGWKIEIVRVKLATPVPGPHGTTLTERVAKIVYSGGSLPDDQFDEFALQLRLPAEAGTLYFPVEQECGEKRRSWSEIPSPSEKPSDLENPAAALVVTPKR